MTLHPDLDRLFQRCRNASSRSFNLHDINNVVLFEKSPVGKTTFAKTLPLLCEAAEKPRLTNHSTRATVTTGMKRMGYSDREVCDITGKISIFSD